MKVLGEFPDRYFRMSDFSKSRYKRTAAATSNADALGNHQAIVRGGPNHTARSGNVFDLALLGLT